MVVFDDISNVDKTCFTEIDYTFGHTFLKMTKKMKKYPWSKIHLNI